MELLNRSRSSIKWQNTSIIVISIYDCQKFLIELLDLFSIVKSIFIQRKDRK
jgi:hypothetical protein